MTVEKAWIYWARFGSDGPIKIGRTHYNPRDRIRNLACSSPFPITLICAMRELTEDEEKQIHGRLRPHRVRGEWFEAEAALCEMRRLDARVVSPENLKQQYKRPRPERRDSPIRIRISQHIYAAMAAQAERERRTIADVFNNMLADIFPRPEGRRL